MAKIWIVTGLFLAGLFFLSPSACLADDELCMTVRSVEGETTLKVHGEIELWREEPWRLELCGTAPARITAEDDAYLGLSLVWAGEDWRWTIAGRRTWRANGTVEALQIRGNYNHSPWNLRVTLGEQDMSDPAAEIGLGAFVARRLQSGWRVSFRQEAAQVTTQVTKVDYRRYRSELTASWRQGNLSGGVVVGGSTALYESAANDRASRYAELAIGVKLDAGWNLDAEVRMDRDWAAGAWSSATSLGLDLIRRAPIGLKLQTDLVTDEDGNTWRAGLAVSGTEGGFHWRLGGAGENKDGPGRACWAYAVCGWRTKTWEIRLGLTPAGEYAVNSRKGYWLEVAYSF